MAFIKVVCAGCSHRGYVAVARLPGILSCSACGRVDLVLAPIEEVTEQIATPPKPKPKPPWRGPRKRILVPRASMPV